MKSAALVTDPIQDESPLTYQQCRYGLTALASSSLQEPLTEWQAALEDLEQCTTALASLKKRMQKTR